MIRAGGRVKWLVAMAALSAAGCPTALLPDFAEWPVDASGYEIETLPVVLAGSYARGHDVYLGLTDGRVYRTDDRDLAGAWIDLNSPLIAGPRCLFVSSRGTIFASHNDEPLFRTSDDGANWAQCLDVPVWRMDEDDAGSLYAGNYTKDGVHHATLYKRDDDGVTWRLIWNKADCDHVHTVRWDDRAKRLYIAYGDCATRGQSYSDDRGASFAVIAEGAGQGHTDAAFTGGAVYWASDDQTGRVYRVDRASGTSETLMGRSQFMWFSVARDRQIYIGTMVSRKTGGERAAMLASDDDGATWRKLMETDVSTGAYSNGFIAESRELSADGWLYFTVDGVSYRLRRAGP